MADPVEIPVASGCCDDIFSGVTRADLLGSRLSEILCRLKNQVPDVFIPVDIYRSYVATLDPEVSSDDQDVAIARIAEGVVGVMLEKQDRWFQSEYGVIRIRVRELWLPSVYAVRPDDHVVLANNEQAMVIDAVTNTGVTITRIDDSKKRLDLPPARNVAINRVIYVGARIV